MRWQLTGQRWSTSAVGGSPCKALTSLVEVWRFFNQLAAELQCFCGEAPALATTVPICNV
ncbi:hypothetical protein L195_g014103 [Trifolium pratense]|uniref:Uncharacterized protein n=1 Tax=Trifolium pratense TaxID=57577 RepID=A0A2K3PPZ4_TRIPR|nr:hypothetical protein L195_g014103 [Trifolium pratense]